MKKIIYYALLMLSILLITGCDEISISQTISAPQDPLVGNWRVELWGIEQIITFEPDNTVSFNNGYDGLRIYSYEIKDDKIILTNLDGGEVHDREFKVIGNYKALRIGAVTYAPAK